MRRIVGCLVTLLMVPLAIVGGPARAEEPVEILIYGDSITQGSSGDYTWRYFLDRHLGESGVAFDFVGPRDGLHHMSTPGDGGSSEDDQTYAVPGFDTESGAVWGQTLAIPYYELGSLVSEHRPDIVVALIGLNDLNFLTWTPDQVADLWRTKIAAAREVDPGVDIVLVQVPDVWYPGVPTYNERLVSLAAELDRPDDDSRVVTTALPSFVASDDTWDGTHPTASGDVKIAGVVEDALHRIGVGAAAGAPPAVVNGPLHAPSVTAVPVFDDATSTWGASLTWQAVPGTTSEWVETRDDTADAPWTRLPIAQPSDVTSWTARGLAPGHRYQFRLRPAKGTAVSEVTSPVVSVVPGMPPAAPVVTSLTADASGTVRVAWAPVATATSYLVGLRDASQGEGWRWMAATTSLAHVLQGLTNGHRYEVRVRADLGALEGSESFPAAKTVPLLDPVRHVQARSPRRDGVRTAGRAVRFAAGYRLLVAPARSCVRAPRAGAFRPSGRDRKAPTATVHTRSRALWVRWYAVRHGVPGRLAPTSSTCTRVR